VGTIEAGVQARAQLPGLSRHFEITQVKVFDPSQERPYVFLKDGREYLNCDIMICKKAQEACQCDILVIAAAGLNACAAKPQSISILT